MSAVGGRDPRHIALDVSKIIGVQIARLARLDDYLTALEVSGEDRRRVEHIRRELREVRDQLRPIDASLWRAARESLAREDQEDQERAVEARPVLVEVLDAPGSRSK